MKGMRNTTAMVIGAALACGALIALAEPKDPAPTAPTAPPSSPTAPPDSPAPSPQPTDPKDIVEDSVVPINQKTLLADLLKQSSPVVKHKLLESFIGDWTIKSTYIPGPGADPIEGTGTATGKLIIGGRFLQLAANMTSQNVQSESLITLGFDTRTRGMKDGERGEFTLNSIDSFGCYAVDARGQYDEAAKTFTLKGTLEEPTPKDDEPWRKFEFQIAITFKSKDRWTQVIQLQLQDGGWVTTNVLEFTRVTTGEQGGSAGAAK